MSTQTTHAPTRAQMDHRPWLHALLAAGGAYLLWRLLRGMGNFFWTLFGLVLAFFWVAGGRWFW